MSQARRAKTQVSAACDEPTRAVHSSGARMAGPSSPAAIVRRADRTGVDECLFVRKSQRGKRGLPCAPDWVGTFCAFRSLCRHACSRARALWALRADEGVVHSFHFRLEAKMPKMLRRIRRVTGAFAVALVLGFGVNEALGRGPDFIIGTCPPYDDESCYDACVEAGYAAGFCDAGYCACPS